MPDDDTLPDSDYESIYGHEALEERRRARHAAQLAALDTITAKQDVQLARLDALIAANNALRDRLGRH